MDRWYCMILNLAFDLDLQMCWRRYALSECYVSSSRYIPVHDIVDTLGPSRAKALPAFHALTGCNTTSASFGKGKKRTWEVWQLLPELTLPLELLSRPSPTLEVIRIHTSVLHRFVLLHQGKDFEHMPSSRDALHQHLLRVAYE